MNRMFITLIIAELSMTAMASAALADPMTGDVAAAYDTAAAASDNPANAAFVDRTEVSFSPELFRSESLQVRYPNFESVSQNESGLGSLLSMGKPGFIYKPNSRFGIGGYAIPPIGLSSDIRKERIPVVILDTLDYVDLDAVGKLNGAASLTAGYRFDERFAVGARFVYQSISFDATLTPSSSSGGEPLATISGSKTSTDVGIGLRYDPSPTLAFGAAFGLVSAGSQSTQVESSLLKQPGSGEDADASESSGARSQVVLPLNSILLGVRFSSQKLSLLADVKYSRADKSQRGFSIVDLKEKRKDVYDTLALRTGMIFALAPGQRAMAGFKYEPAGVGPGAKSSADDEGSIGFGTQELFMVFAGFEPLTPYWQMGLGVEWGFERQKVRGKDFYAWTVATGLAYQRASLGIDENGEQPGAYLYQKTFVPLTVTYKM